MADRITKHILVLVDNLNDYLSDFFSQDGFQVYKREEVENIESLDYIIVPSGDDAEQISKEYDTIKNEIQIICYGANPEYRKFLLANGRFILDEKMQKNNFSEYVLSKYFSGFANIHLDESMPDEFQDIQNFKVINHLTVGYSVDEISVNAFENGFNLVPIRSFVDHVIYYFTYLKQAGLAGIPFEFEVGYSDSIFAINVHASVKNFVAEYMIDSFGPVNSNDPLKYLLGVIARSCDFLDLTYIENPGKLVITGFFTKDELNKISGIVFNNILTSSQVLSQVERKIQNFIPQNEKSEKLKELQENLKDSRLPGGIMEMVSPAPEGSILSENPALVEKITNYMIQSFEKEKPDESISEFNVNDFIEFESHYDDQELIQKLTEEDKNFLTEKIQKSNLTKAYENEVSKIRSEIKDDEEYISEIQDVMKDDIVSKVSSHIGIDLLNNILSKETDEEIPEVEKFSAFGDFTPSVPQNFEVGSAFDDLSPDFQNTNFDGASLLSDLESEFGNNSDELISESIEGFDISEMENEFVPDFGPSGFDEVLTTVPGTFDQNKFEETQVVSGGIEEDPFSQTVSGGSLENENDVNLVKGSKDDEEGAIKIGGGPDDPEAATIVKGGKEEADDFLQKISGMSDDDEGNLIQSFSSSFEDGAKDQKFMFNSSNSEERKKDLKMFVKSTLDDSGSLGSMDMKVKAFVHKEAPDRINAGLERFADSLGKTLDDLSVDNLEEFKSSELPSILTNLVRDNESIADFKDELESYIVEDNAEELNAKTKLVVPGAASSSFEKSFKEKIESKLSDIEDISKVDDKYVVSEGNISEEKMQFVVQSAMRETFEEEFKFSNASQEEIDAKEAQLIKDLSKTLDMPEEDVRVIVKGASDLAREKEKQIVAEKLYGEENLDESKNFSTDGVEEQEYKQQTNSKVEAELISKLKTFEAENNKLKTNVSALQLQLQSADVVKKKFEQVMNEAEASEDEIIHGESKIQEPALNIVEKKQLISDLKEGKTLDSDTAEKLQRSLEKENEIIELAKAAETQLKKANIAAEKKDALFKTELSKAQKALKAKEIVLEKAKDSMKNVMSKKEKELVGLKSQVNELNQKLKNDQSTQLKVQVKALGQEKEVLQRTADVYKNKLESMAKNLESGKREDNSTQINEENRNLKRLKNQLENKLNSESKLKKSFEDRYQKAKQAETQARNDAVSAKTELKTVQGQIKLLKDQNTKLVQSAASSGNIAANKTSKELEQIKGKNTKLQEKVKELTKKLEAASGATKDTPLLDAGKIAEAQASRTAHDEKQARKEVEHMKSQNEALQNKITELVEKLKKSDEAATSKKTSSADSGSAKEKRLEQSVKKMNSELTKARAEAAEKKKEAMKAKTEITGLKNQLAKMKKDLEKAQKSGGAKGKKKAA